MLITTLVENNSISDELQTEHGLSLYIELNDQKILVDLGASDLFAQNAAKMGVDIAAVDVAVISHGHWDHGGGIKTFLQANKQAKIYLNRNAFGDYYAKREQDVSYIGLDKDLLPQERFIFVDDDHTINDQLEIFSGVKNSRLKSPANDHLLMKTGGILTQDNFVHEQNLIIKEADKSILIAGCAHNGIVNILDHYYCLKGSYPDYVFGGFHLPSQVNVASNQLLVRQIAQELIKTGSKYYTGHCTGLEAYKQLKTIMGDRVEYLATGSTWDLAQGE